MVAPGAVRTSHRYRVQVRKHGGDASSLFRDAFVHETLPRNGRGKIYSPWDPPGSSTFQGDDGVSIEIEAGVTMAWAQFEYAATDVDVKITRRDGTSLGDAANVVIRPTTQHYDDLEATADGGIVVRVPADPAGRRFSVEFQDDALTYRADGATGRYVNTTSSGGGGSAAVAVGTEPRNALLIFASPFLSDDLQPPMTSDNTHTMTPGAVRPANGDLGASSILYFPPGVYWVDQAASDPTNPVPKYGESHLILHPNTTWVHFAAGAFVKGAVEYTCASEGRPFYATGHGVLSGEHYVYQANPQSFYQGKKSDEFSLRMWSHRSVRAGQVWHCSGPTIVAPPFNSMDFWGATEEVSVRISDYKQVGSYFMQTDGPEMYPGSIVRDVFYHVNDDGIKAYYSNATVINATVWKCHNDPIIQVGWSAREVSGVRVAGLNVIHSRYKSDGWPYVPSAIIGGSPLYKIGGGRRGAALHATTVNNTRVDPTKTLQMVISDVVVEGPWNGGPALIRVTPLVNYDIEMRGVSYPQGLLLPAPPKDALELGRSTIPAASPAVSMKLVISDWIVGGEAVTMENFQSDRLGQLDIDASYWGQWSIED